MNVIIDETGFKTLQIIAQANNFNEWIYKTIHPYLKGEILEIGSGIGNISQYVINDTLPITLSDFNPEYVIYLKNKYEHLNNVKAIISIDLQEKNFFEKYLNLKGRFDSIILLNVIEHLAEDSKALEFCNYLLAEDGNLIVLAPAYNALFCSFDKELGHFRRYTKKRIVFLLRNLSFKIISSRYFNFLGIAGWVMYGKFLRHNSIQQNEMSRYNKLVGFAKFLDMLVLRKLGLSIITVAQKK